MEPFLFIYFEQDILVKVSKKYAIVNINQRHFYFIKFLNYIC